MTRALEAISELMKSLVDEESKPPLHVGEVMNLWTSLTGFQEARALYQAALNTTTDKDLIHTLENAIQGSKADYELIKKFMVQEGIPLSAINEEKPKSDPKSVPEGVKLTDDEIANLISVKVAAAIVFCAQAMSQYVRTDVGMLFFQVQVELMKFASPLKNLMKSRGWLKIPPHYLPPGIPEQK
ncbi:DUF3231 family protein [Bacillus taeanensis]|uniref:DUF3231 domain-containing protein n=1 Tax=Bacillus taeanensis TaxID=273032 RepID=A0A366XR64_9BACI|nr:DUF3231 family protein [Bacillus taeanensis]RBW67615.1 hypothetical protein DS031_21330 [Bacillus taeanensis]